MMDHQINENTTFGLSLLVGTWHTYTLQTTTTVDSDNLILWCSFARPYFPLFDTITTTSVSIVIAGAPTKMENIIRLNVK